MARGLADPGMQKTPLALRRAILGAARAVEGLEAVGLRSLTPHPRGPCTPRERCPKVASDAPIVLAKPAFTFVGDASSHHRLGLGPPATSRLPGDHRRAASLGRYGSLRRPPALARGSGGWFSSGGMGPPARRSAPTDVARGVAEVDLRRTPPIAAYAVLGASALAKGRAPLAPFPASRTAHARHPKAGVQGSSPVRMHESTAGCGAAARHRRSHRP